MANETVPDHGQASGQTGKNRKHKKKKSKAANKTNGEAAQPNGTPLTHEEDNDDEEDDADLEPTTDTNAGVDMPPERRNSQDWGNGDSSDPGGGSDPAQRLEAAARERDQLRSEVTALRKSLEDIRKKHAEESAAVSKQLEETKAGKDHADTRYQKLLGQVNTIKAQLGERLKADAEELAQARSRIEELEVENNARQGQHEALQDDLAKARSELDQQSKEITSVRGRTNVSQQNWAKERDDLVSREAHAREEFDAARQAMQDWEVLATEERSLREGMEERVGGLEEQLSAQRDAYERASTELEGQNATVEGLQRALQEIHEARKEERRELVESSHAQLDESRKQAADAEISLKELQTELEKARADFEKAALFEREVREKNLLIGKLRQEAVILNDHLTKALRFLKRGKKDDNVDRQLVTNYLLHFLALDRTDPKKFQVLQLMSSILGWTEEQQEQAGLARPGASSQTVLKVPLSSPFRRVSSSATLSPLSSPYSNIYSPPIGTGDGGAAGRESLAELWSDFLEREAEEATPRAGNSNVASPPSSSVDGFESAGPGRK